MSERPFFVAFLLAISIIAGLYYVGFVYIPIEGTQLHIGLHILALVFCLVNYINEYHGLMQLSYSKFTKNVGSVNPRVGWVITYGLPVVVYSTLWYLSGKPLTSYHLIAMATYNCHFVKRILECMALHKYSRNIEVASIIQIGMFYSLGAVVQHYWCNIYTSPSLAVKLSENKAILIAGMALYIIGELTNLGHHYILSTLRPEGSQKYVIPTGGLFGLVICPHYFGELLAWLGMAIQCQHSCIYLSWLTMIVYLAGRSHQTRLWYISKFDNFPQNLKNLFPAIY